MKMKLFKYNFIIVYLVNRIKIKISVANSKLL